MRRRRARELVVSRGWLAEHCPSSHPDSRTSSHRCCRRPHEAECVAHAKQSGCCCLLLLLLLLHQGQLLRRHWRPALKCSLLLRVDDGLLLLLLLEVLLHCLQRQLLRLRLLLLDGR
jgi:hypothetical protein